MTPDEFARLPARSIAAGVQRGELSAQAVVRAAIARTELLEPRLNTLVTRTFASALYEARAVDARVARGEWPGALAGVPVTVKDLIAVGGVRQTFGSRLLAQNVAAHDAPSVARLRAAGACLLGKSTTSELGSQAVGFSPLTGFTRNPWNEGHTAGGSSAGAAAAVSAGLVPVALGTDGGGSIRIPASFCGLVGIKATFGRVPVWPPSATPSVAHVGPLARDLADAVLLLSVIAGPDERDPGTLLDPVPDFAAALGQGVRGLRVAWCPGFRDGAVLPGIVACCESAARALQAEGAAVTAIASPFSRDPGPAWNHLFFGSLARKLDELARTPADRERVNPRLREAAAAEQARGIGQDAAAALRALAREEAEALFGRFDVLLSPTMPVTAPAVGVDVPPGHETRNAVDWSTLTYPFNLTGHPAISMPVGLDAEGLPIGLQIVARRGDECTALRVAAAVERSTPFTHRPPPVPE